MIKFYGSHTPIFMKPLVAAEELGIPYEVEFVDVLNGDNKKAAHLQRHPFGKVPVLEHNGRYLFESNTILRYLGGLVRSELYPDHPFERALVDQWMDYYSFQLGRWITTVWFQRNIAPKFFNENPDEKVIASSLEQIVADLPVVNDQLQKHRYVAGDTFTLADVNAFMLCGRAEEAGISFSDFPAFKRWIDEVSKRPSVIKIFQKWF